MKILQKLDAISGHVALLSLTLSAVIIMGGVVIRAAGSSPSVSAGSTTPVVITHTQPTIVPTATPHAQSGIVQVAKKSAPTPVLTPAPTTAIAPTPAATSMPTPVPTSAPAPVPTPTSAPAQSWLAMGTYAGLGYRDLTTMLHVTNTLKISWTCHVGDNVNIEFAPAGNATGQITGWGQRCDTGTISDVVTLSTRGGLTDFIISVDGSDPWIVTVYLWQ